MNKNVGYFQTFKNSDDVSSRVIRSKNLSFMPHMHTQTELIYMLSGNLNFSIGTAEYLLKGGTMAVISPYKVHSFTDPINCECLVMIFEKQLIPEWTNSIKNMEIINPVLTISDYPNELTSIISSIVNINKNNFNSDTYQLILKGLLTTLVGLLIDKLKFSQISSAKVKHLGYTQRVIEYISENYNQTECTLTELSKELEISYTIVQRVFIEQLSCHFSDYLVNLRLQHANSLMSADMKLIDIAYESGFTSLRSFYRNFSRTYGMSPGKYREMLHIQKKSMTTINFEDKCN